MTVGRFLDQDLELFEKSMQLDYFGSLYLAKAVLPGMVRRGAGRLLFVASPLAAIGRFLLTMENLDEVCEDNVKVTDPCSCAYFVQALLGTQRTRRLNGQCEDLQMFSETRCGCMQWTVSCSFQHFA